MRATPVILHVEDNDATAYLVQYAFRHQDRRVDLIRLCNGNEGSSFLGQIGIYAEAPRPDLVLLDLHLPERNGFQLLAEIKSQVKLEKIPVIILSSSTQPKDCQMALSAGASEYLVKPADLAGFPALIQAILAHIAPGEHPSGEPPKL